MDRQPLDRKDLKSKSLNGAVINLTSQMVKFCLLFVNQVVMARFLMPADFGLVAMVAPIMAFIVLFADLGLSQATIQRPKISQEELSFLFWTNVAVASTLALIVMLISPLAGMFYHEPRVVAITVVMGATLVLSGLTTQHIAILTRHMEYKKLVVLDLGSLILGFTAGLVSAACGMNYWSLVMIHITIYVTNLVGAWAFSTWRPSKPVLPENWRQLLGFGGNLSGFNLVNYFARNLDNILIGRVNGEVALGLYDRAYKLLLMPLTQITQPFARISLPLLARTRDDAALYKKAYLRMVQVILLVTYPGVLYAVIDSDNVIRTVLGERWAGVAPIFGVLGCASFFGTISHTTGWLFISQDRTREMRNWGIFSSALIISSFIAGLHWGPIGVATAYLTVTTVQGPIVWWAVTRKGPVTLKDLVTMLVPFGLSSAVAGTAIFFARYVLPKGIISVIVLLPVTYMLFMAAFFILPAGRKVLVELFENGMMLVGPFMAKFKPRPVQMEDEPL